MESIDAHNLTPDHLIAAAAAVAKDEGSNADVQAIAAATEEYCKRLKGVGTGGKLPDPASVAMGIHLGMMVCDLYVQADQRFQLPITTMN